MKLGISSNEIGSPSSVPFLPSRPLIAQPNKVLVAYGPPS